MLSSPLTGHQNAKADETQSSQTQEDYIHGVELWSGGFRSHTWKDSQSVLLRISTIFYTRRLHVEYIYTVYSVYTKGLERSFLLVTASI